jgi:iron complex outermembrane receptor protein
VCRCLCLGAGRLERAIALAAWLALAACPPAWAQHASDNAVVSAEDAFGLTIGTETIGLYDQNQVRGFSPQAAGNARIGGLYFDQQSPLSARVIEGSTIRVGMSALGFPFPAPTGIVDYDLRHASDKAACTAVVDSGPFEARGFDLDGQYPVPSLNLRVPIGISDRIDAGLPGYTTRNTSAGVAPQWTLREGLVVRAFWDWQQISQANVAPLIFMNGPGLPPQVPASYLGQSWANGKSHLENYGATIAAQLSRHLTLSAGIFRSVNDSPVGYADLYVNSLPTGEGDHVLIGYPDQRTASTSGDIRLAAHFADGAFRHELVFSVRGRDALALYDGADVRDVGAAVIGEAAQLPRPDFTYGPRTRDENQLWMAGVAYHGRWSDRGELSVGAEKANYRKVILVPGESAAERSDQPWRLYGVAAVTLFNGASAYAGYTQGIEDSGVAPSNAANRGEILPATRTWQRDAGLQYALAHTMKFIAGVFDVHKPYFNLDASNNFVGLGDQDYQGFEFSISGEVIKNLNVVAGLELLNPRVTADQSARVPIGRRAIGKNDHLAQLNLDYKLASLPSISADLTWYSYGRRAASFDNSVSIPSTQTLDIGARYRFNLHGAPAALRLLVQNVGNVYSWALTDSAGFSPAPRRSAQLYLTVDF